VDNRLLSAKTETHQMVMMMLTSFSHKTTFLRVFIIIRTRS